MNIHLCNFSPAYVGNEISNYICRVSFYPGFKELFIHLSFFLLGTRGKERGKKPVYSTWVTFPSIFMSLPIENIQGLLSVWEHRVHGIPPGVTLLVSTLHPVFAQRPSGRCPLRLGPRHPPSPCFGPSSSLLLWDLRPSHLCLLLCLSLL